MSGNSKLLYCLAAFMAGLSLGAIYAPAPAQDSPLRVYGTAPNGQAFYYADSPRDCAAPQNFVIEDDPRLTGWSGICLTFH